LRLTTGCGINYPEPSGPLPVSCSACYFCLPNNHTAKRFCNVEVKYHP